MKHYRYINKKLIIFDLDDTLSPSKVTIDQKMSQLLVELLRIRKVAIISGASFERIQQQVVAGIEQAHVVWGNLYLFPTCGTVLYQYAGGGWQELYNENLSPEEKREIFAAFPRALKLVLPHSAESMVNNWKIVRVR